MSTELVCPFKNEIIYSDTPSTEQELWYNQNVYGVIYKITNILNNKSYIGRRKCVKNKLSSLHRYWGSGSYIQNAIKKYGLENFTKEYLDFAMSDEELDILEIKYIEKFNTYKDGYNQTIGGEHFRGEFSNNELRKQKISSWSKKFWSNEENHKTAIEKRTGRKNSKTTKELMSVSAKKSWTEERRRKASESGNYSRTYTPEQIEHSRQVHKGKVHVNNGKTTVSIKVEELETYLSNGWKRGNHKAVSSETKKRMSEAAKNRKPTTKGKKMIHKDNIRKYVLPCDLQKFLDDGWLLGPVK
jgi:group I intron endonuclease